MLGAKAYLFDLNKVAQTMDCICPTQVFLLGLYSPYDITGFTFLKNLLFILLEPKVC